MLVSLSTPQQQSNLENTKRNVLTNRCKNISFTLNDYAPSAFDRQRFVTKSHAEGAFSFTTYSGSSRTSGVFLRCNAAQPSNGNYVLLRKRVHKHIRKLCSRWDDAIIGVRESSELQTSKIKLHRLIMSEPRPSTCGETDGVSHDVFFIFS